ncbi:hypothetical protein NQ317_002475 [Molorchus minor]|uniref:DUF5641 domain-containing protein n=1 Tax=Molorchus minor TaxID=1323400 RepID=A0ABQ9JHQ4_9CUCU|nr:hypothetical protein NQ317_002475 [Molorchus minor]
MAPKSENELKLDRLRARRENLFRRLQLCYEAGELLKADRSDPTKLENFKIRHVSMLKVMSEYREVVNEIVCTKQAIKPDEPVSYSTLDAAEDLYDRIEYTSSQYVPRPVSSNLENTNSHKTRLHMPKIEIVKFDATDLSLWPVFYENFRQLIHDNTEFSKAEKLQYLLGSLAGKALKTVSAIEIVPNNYDIIFKLLVDTYHDKKLLSNMYLDRLLSFRAISNNNPDSLQLFLERFDTNVAALYRLNLENLGDYIITHIAMSKLSQETINAFELVRDSQELPNYEELLKFIRKQSKIAVVVEKTRKFPNHPTHSTFARGPKTFVTNNNNNYSKGRNCLFCDKGSVRAYPNFSCRFCGSKHHSLLHKTNVPTNSFNVNNNVTPSTSTSSTDNDIIRENRESVNIQTLCSKINVIESNKPNIVLLSGFQMVKWVSNSPELLSHIPEDIKLPSLVDFEKGNWKVLGLQWNPFADFFCFSINLEKTLCTKRNMLSLISRTYDPLGMLSPTTLFVKLLINKLWKIKLDWDESAPQAIEKTWEKFQDEFSLLNELKIPRHVLVFENTSLEIIGFADASSAGLASVVYIRAVDTSGHVSVTFLCAQTKVAPISSITLPRLELAAATNLASLIDHVRDTFSKRTPIKNIYAFSDSMITLNWIHSSPRKWKTFVSNRVTKIQNYLPASHWYFVSGKENVSDCASRGLTPSALLKHPTWFTGPPWMVSPFSQWPIKSFAENIDPSVFEKEILIHVVMKDVKSSLYKLIEYFSSWSKLLHSTVYVLRFIRLLPIHYKIIKSDLDKAEHVLIRVVQQQHFPEEFKCLSENKLIQSNIRRLNPFIKNGIIRVGGRLNLSNLSFEQKHPILLPKSDPLVNLLIDYNHKLYCHTGSFLLHSLLRQNYWILSAHAIVNQYWKRWHLEYLSTLQSRQKWNTPSCPAKLSYKIIFPPLQWPLAIIEKLHFGKDGVARIALVKTKTGTYLRPIVKLCPLPNQ